MRRHCVMVLSNTDASAGAMACMGMSIFGALFMGGMALMLKNDYQ